MMIRIILTVVIATLFIPKAQGGDNADSLLRVLDSELPAREKYIDQRRSRISAEMQQLSKATSDSGRYSVLRSLYSLYHNFDLDSALSVAVRRLEMARQLGDTMKIISASLNLAESSIAMGSFKSAQELLDNLDRRLMLDYHLRYSYDLYAKLFHHLRLNDGIPSNRRRYELLENAYLDSLAMFPKTHTRPASRPLINRAVSTYRDSEREEAKALLAEATLIDIREGRRDMESLVRLADMLCEDGDYERSYQYITVALDDARAAGAQSRAAEILQATSVIERAHNAMVRESVGKMHRAMAVIAVLALVALSALVCSLIMLRANRRASRRLKEVNAELEKANMVKELHISHLFDSQSQHIEQIMALRKQCLQQLRAGKLSQLEKTLSSSTAENAGFRNMYSQFDNIFLSMYPGFIDEYNSRVDPEYRIDASAGSLTPELRVQALITLGITDSARIARLLHYSPQTVYNYRSRLKLRLKNTETEL